MGPRIPRLRTVPNALQEIGIPEAPIDTMKIGEESAPHLGKGAVVTVTVKDFKAIRRILSCNETNNVNQFYF